MGRPDRPGRVRATADAGRVDRRLAVRVTGGPHAGRRGMVEKTLGLGYCLVQLDGEKYYKIIKMDLLEPLE